jgi:hypothetical protein
MEDGKKKLGNVRKKASTGFGLSDFSTNGPFTLVKKETSSNSSHHHRVILDPNTNTDEEEEMEHSNYSTDIATAVATILEGTSRDPVLEEHRHSASHNASRPVVAQPSKSKKKILKSKSVKITNKVKRSKSTIHTTAGSGSKSRLSLSDNAYGATKKPPKKSKSNTSATIDALNLHSGEFSEPRGPKDEDDEDDDGMNLNSILKVSFLINNS